MSSVYLFSDKWLGSGVYVGDNKILTAKHLATKGDLNARFFGRSGDLHTKVVWESNEFDLAVLSVEGEITVPAAQLTCQPMRISQKVTVVGAPAGMPFTVTEGFLAGQTADGILMDVTVLKGTSGGPVFDASGYVVGIVHGLITEFSGVVPTRLSTMAPTCNHIPRGIL